jgi:hypothetical protein
MKSGDEYTEASLRDQLKRISRQYLYTINKIPVAGDAN